MLRRSKTTKLTRRHARNQLHQQSAEPEAIPFIEHIQELRKRLFYVACSIALFGGSAAFAQERLTEVLLKPAGDQQFIYTTPGGGFDFAFRLALYAGVALSVPVIVYNLLVYIQPLLKKETAHFIALTSIWSSILAFIGIMFGYFVALPAGLHFLLQSFSTDQIKALISIQSYLEFVTTYLLGSALLFQIPLVLILINRVMPLKPKSLMGYQRWVVIVSFVLGALISPTPDIRNQAVLSLPVIFMYNLSIIIIWGINRKSKRPKFVAEMLRKDAELQAGRLANFEKAQVAWQQTVRNAIPAAVAAPAVTRKPAPVARPVRERPQKYLQDFVRRPSRSFMG